MSSVDPKRNPYHSGSFFEQMTTLCNDIGYGWQSGTAGDSQFQSIVLFRSQEEVLTIVLIDYQTLLLPDAKESYKLALEYIRQLRQQGRTAIMLWEDHWIRAQNIVISRVKASLGMSVRIPGRLTYAARINKSTADAFFHQHHLQGNVSSKYRYGLFLPVRYFRVLPQNFIIKDSSQDLLVAAATYSNAKIFKRDGSSHRSCELIRFANHCETTVVGGIDKMIRAFVADFKPDDIMTYADLEWSDGTSYEKLGFEYISQRAPINLFLDIRQHTRYTSDTHMESGHIIPITNAGSNKFVKQISH